MRRITDLRARNTRKYTVEDEGKSMSGASTRSDVLYNLSHYDQRLKALYRFTDFNANRITNILAPWKKSYERRAYYDAAAAFDVDIGPFTSLELLRISESCVFDLSKINNTRVKRLELTGILKIRIAHYPVNVSLQEILLKDLSITYNILRSIVRTPLLVSISLENVEILGNGDWKLQLVDDLKMASSLREIRMINMGIELQCFSKLCKSMDLTCFLISDVNVHAEAVFVGRSVNTLRFHNSLEHFKFVDFGTAESIYIKGTDIKHILGTSLPRLKSLCMKQVVVDSNAFRSLYLKHSKLFKLEFIECVFDHVSFYEIVSHFRESLKYLNLRCSNLPHDYLAFIQNKLVFCFVKLKNGELITIDNNSSVKKIKLDV